MAAAIRLGHFGLKTVILEQHYAPGGLNSFYRLEGHTFDTGLHAMTNYAAPGRKGALIDRVFRQLRLSRDSLELCPQIQSRIRFPSGELRFSNDPVDLEASVQDRFPAQVEAFRALLNVIEGNASWGQCRLSARQELSRHLGDPLLVDMLLCPVLAYGSATAGDIDWESYCALFRSIFLEGFSRPKQGITALIQPVLQRLRQVGVERRMKTAVERIDRRSGGGFIIHLTDGEVIETVHVLSSAGLEETSRLVGESLLPEGFPLGPAEAQRRISVFETQSVLGPGWREFGWEDTVLFLNRDEQLVHAPPEALVEDRLLVVCVDGNYRGSELADGGTILRVSAIAAAEGWERLGPEAYQEAKEHWRRQLLQLACEGLGGSASVERIEALTRIRDSFTPLTVKRFTGHVGGAIYGSPEKLKDGVTRIPGLYLCGADTGLLGIVGAMLSGIHVANLQLIRRSDPACGTA